MKKTFYSLLVGAMLVIGTGSYAQVSGTRFVPENSNPISMAAQNGISVSYQQGTLGTTPAICLDFKNTSSHKIAFTWILKDASGKIIHTGKQLTLEAGQSLNPDKDPALKAGMTFMINDGMKAADYKTEITIKN